MSSPPRNRWIIAGPPGNRLQYPKQRKITGSVYHIPISKYNHTNLERRRMRHCGSSTAVRDVLDSAGKPGDTGPEMWTTSALCVPGRAGHMVAGCAKPTLFVTHVETT